MEIVYFRMFHARHTRRFVFKGTPLDMQWLTLAGKIELELGLPVPEDAIGKRKRGEVGKLIAFRNEGPFGLERAIHPKEIIEPEETIVLKRVPHWLWKEWIQDLPEIPIAPFKLYPKNATEEDQMYIVVKTSAWKTQKDIPYEARCFICNSTEHMKDQCPDRRICGIPKNFQVPQLIPLAPSSSSSLPGSPCTPQEVHPLQNGGSLRLVE